jgi:hypothetical protein
MYRILIIVCNFLFSFQLEDMFQAQSDEKLFNLIEKFSDEDQFVNGEAINEL